jgi:hypothetical protein
MALYAEDELLMISTFHESLSECVVTWFYQLRNITCWEDLARAFLDQYRRNPKTMTPRPKKEKYKLTPPPVGDLSINATTTEGDSTTPPSHHRQLEEEERLCLIPGPGKMK